MSRVHHLVRRSQRVCADVSRPGGRHCGSATWPTWRSAIPGAAIPLRCSAGRAARLERLTYADDRCGRRASHARCCSVCWRSGASRGAVAYGADRPAVAALTAATTFVALGGTSLARTGTRMADLLARGDIDGARRLLPSLCGRDPAALDADGLTRAAAGIGRREHLRRAGGAAAVGGGRRRARAAGLPRRQHPRRDDRSPLAALSRGSVGPQRDSTTR